MTFLGVRVSCSWFVSNKTGVLRKAKVFTDCRSLDYCLDDPTPPTNGITYNWNKRSRKGWIEVTYKCPAGKMFLGFLPSIKRKCHDTRKWEPMTETCIDVSTTAAKFLNPYFHLLSL